ncbi:MAG: PAS domain S-box protein [Rhodospirillales bacterium]
MFLFTADLIRSLALVAVLAWLVTAAARFSWIAAHPYIRDLIAGLLFGAVIAVVMLDPVRISEGAVFDLRGGPAILAGMYAGPIGALVSGVIGAGVRWYYVGGPVALGGVAGFALYGLFGLLAGLYVRRKNIGTSIHLLACIAVLGTVAVLPSFFISADAETAFQILAKAGPLLFAANLFGTLVLGSLINVMGHWYKLRDEREKEMTEHKRLALIARDTINGVVITDQGGAVEWVNEGFERISGYRLHELVGKSPGSILQGPDSDPAIDEEMKACIARGEGFSVETLNYNKSGQPYWVSIKCEPFLEPGMPPKFMAIETDITERVKADSAIRASQERIADFARVSSDWFWELDENLCFTFISEQYEAITGFKVAQRLGTNVIELAHTDIAAWKNHRQRLARHEAFRNFQYPLSCADGRTIDLSVSGEPIFDAQGMFRGYRGTCRDITKQKMVERALAASESLYRTLAATAPVGVVRANSRGKVIYVNDWLTDTTGHPTHHFLASDWINTVVPEDRDRIEQAWQEYITDGKPMREEVRLGHADEQGVIHMFLQASPEKDKNGRIIGHVATFTDITTQKKHEDELIEAQARLEAARDEAETANRAKSEFLATMSHEIRTPMTGVMGFADLLLREEMSPEGREKVYKIKDATRALLSILNDILDISKLDADKLEIEDLDFRLSTLIEDVVGLFAEKRSGDRARDMPVRVEFADEFPTEVHGDPTRLRQVLVNLVGNAVKFTSEGEVRVVCDMMENKGDRFIRVAVVDTGIGIKPEVLPNLFKEFTQADASITRMFEGTGLGLAICKRLVERQGGEIGVESSFGTGSRFWFTLPYVPARSEIVHEATSAYSSATNFEARRPLKILIAEDNDLNQQILDAIVSGFGHQVSIANNGKEAVDRYAEESFDLILMDVRMPEMSGPEATRIIRKMHGDKSGVPIIALTADLMSEHQREYLEAGMNAVSPKPVDPGNLTATIDEVLGEELHLPISNEGTGAKRVVKTQEVEADFDGLLNEMSEFAGDDLGGVRKA